MAPEDFLKITFFEEKKEKKLSSSKMYNFSENGANDSKLPPFDRKLNVDTENGVNHENPI